MTHTKKIGAGLALAAAIAITAPSFASAAVLYRSLDVGSTGSDVTALQSFLAQDVNLYPSGRVTGYYGTLTRAAVTNFQVRNGISAVGRVGPITLAALNAQMDGGVTYGADVSAPIISRPSVTANNSSMTIAWNTDEAARGIVYYSTSPIVVNENMGMISPVGAMSASSDSNYKTSQNVVITNLTRDTSYYYMIMSTDATGNVNVTWPANIRTQQ